MTLILTSGPGPNPNSNLARTPARTLAPTQLTLTLTSARQATPPLSPPPSLALILTTEPGPNPNPNLARTLARTLAPT